MQKKKTVEVMSGCGFLAQLAFIITCYALYSITGSRALLAQTWFLAPGLFLWVIVYLHSRQRRLARSEKEEIEQLRKGRLSEEIFEGQELDRMRANTGLKIFEKYLVPAFSLLLSAGLGILCYVNLRALIGAEPVEIAEPLSAVAGMAAMTFFGFLLGKYAVGLSHSRELQLLRAPASYLMGNVMTALLLVVATTMVHFGAGWLEAASAFIIPAFMGLIAFEVLLNMVLDIYRPRVPDQQWRPAYDSRLLNLCAEPAGVFETFAAMLDYQFGFKISETWLYSFMQRAILPLILVQIAALWALSCLVVIPPGESAFIERWGRPKVDDVQREAGIRAATYAPGFHIKWPWPIETVRRFESDYIYRKVVGKLLYEDEPDIPILDPDLDAAPVKEDEDIVLWRELHVDPEIGREAEFLVPSVGEVEIENGAPALNIARLMARLHYRIKRGPDGRVDPEAAYNFYYLHDNPHRFLENLAFQAVCNIASSQNFLRWMHVERREVSEHFARDLQQAVDAHGLGIELVYVGMPSVHPPAGVSDAYEAVINAYQEKESRIYRAEREATRMVKEAEGERSVLLNEARAYAHGLKRVSEAEQEQFQERIRVYGLSPEVYRMRQHFSTLEDVFAGHRLYIVPVTEKEVNIIDMKGKRPTDIMDIDL